MMLRAFPVLLALGCGLGCDDAASNSSGDGPSHHPSGGELNSGDGDGEEGTGGTTGGTTGGAENGGGSGGASNLGGASGGAIETTGGQDGDGGEAMGGSPESDDPSTGTSGCALAAAGPQILGSVDDRTLIYNSKPEGYDGITPAPLVLAFNATGGDLSLMEKVSNADSTPSDLARDFLIVRIHRRSETGDSWEGEDIELYDAAYEIIERSLCFDKSRIFGVGNAAGGRFLGRWIPTESTSDAVVRPHDFRAVALVGSIHLGGNNSWLEMPTLFVHSAQDSTSQGLFGDADGTNRLAQLQGFMECGENSTSAGSNTFDGANTTCTDFTDCVAPLRFCFYDQPTQYDLWQSLYTTELHRFFSQYL